MKRFVFLWFVSLFALLPSSHAISSDFVSSADNLEGTNAVIASLSDIPQHSVDSFAQDSDVVDRILEMRFNNLNKPFDIDESQPAKIANGTLSPLAPKLFRKFNAMGASGFAPADPNIAVGPDRVVVVVNRSIAFFTKLGQKVFQTTLRDFFGKLPDSDTINILYPKAVYDPYNNHFLVVIEAVRSTDHKSWYFVAASKTSSPQGDWAFWELNMSLNGQAKTGLYADYPGVGLDPQAIYLTGNMANFQNRFQYAKIRVLKKSEVYKFGKLTWHDFFNLTDANGVKAISIQPAMTVGAATSEFLLSSNPTKGAPLTLWNITNPTTNPVLSKKAVPVTTYSVPPDAPQKGGPLKINTGDASLGNVVFRDGIVYAAHTISKSFSTGPVSAIRFYEINTNGTVAQEVTYGVSGTYFYFPITMVDSRGNVSVVFNRSSKGMAVGIAFTGRKPNDPPNTLQSNLTLQPGMTYYHLTTALVQLWGAYNGMALDYDDSIWMVSAFAKKADEWGTIVGKVSY
ncbi:MAG TPA: hypothetical protein VFG11_10460 [Acidobacteriota bacterium]|nr:hypothetical protein [Acidobacteriota bacterium]